MIASFDKAGVRKLLGLAAGTELEMEIEGFARLVRSVASPELFRRGQRLVARPWVAEGERTRVNVAQLIEEPRLLPRKPERTR